jgi:hypothetical protein
MMAGMASTLQKKRKIVMVEKQTIDGKEVWLKIDPYHVNRPNPNVIPTEYFTAAYYFQEPADDATDGQLVTDEDGETKLFESPVAALTHAWKHFGTLAKQGQ